VTSPKARFDDEVKADPVERPPAESVVETAEGYRWFIRLPRKVTVE
jgi:hypothetical protein